MMVGATVSRTETETATVPTDNTVPSESVMSLAATVGTNSAVAPLDPVLAVTAI